MGCYFSADILIQTFSAPVTFAGFYCNILPRAYTLSKQASYLNYRKHLPQTYQKGVDNLVP